MLHAAAGEPRDDASTESNEGQNVRKRVYYKAVMFQFIVSYSDEGVHAGFLCWLIDNDIDTRFWSPVHMCMCICMCVGGVGIYSIYFKKLLFPFDAASLTFESSDK